MTAAHGPSTVAAVLVAGGSGTRLGAAVPKAFCEIEGETLLSHAAWCFVADRRVGSIVAVAPATHVDDAEAVLGALTRRDAELCATLSAIPLGEIPLSEITGAAASAPTGVVVVAGGVTRQASVLAGLAALGPDVRYVLVHDVARPFVPRRVIGAVLAALQDGADAAIPVQPVHDTIRRVDASGALVGVVERSELVAVQTPQGFRREALLRAHAAGQDLAVTDDAALIEAVGGTVVGVPGADELFKITRRWDLSVAEAMLAAGGLDA